MEFLNENEVYKDGTVERFSPLRWNLVGKADLVYGKKDASERKTTNLNMRAEQNRSNDKSEGWKRKTKEL